MKFRFPYEKLRFHKKVEEDLAKKIYLEIKFKVDKANRELRQIYQEIEDSRRRTHELTKSGNTTGAHLSSVDDFISLSAIRIRNKQAELREYLRELEEKHEILVKATIDRKTLDKLKEKRLAEFKIAKRKFDLKVLDEVTTTRFKNEERE